MGVKIEGDKIMLKFTAGAAISKGQVVYVSGDNEVSPATDAEAARCVGVADNDASAGEDVYVIVYGKATVVADGAISAGDRVRAASTAGRVVSENSMPTHSHTITIDDPGHAHVAFKNSGTDASPTTSATQKVVGGDGSEATNVYVTVESGAASENINTDTKTTGISASSSAESASEHGRCIGIALTAASAAGESLTILVTKL